jgi:hypothetical protein
MLRWMARHQGGLIRLILGFFGLLLVFQGAAALWLGQIGTRNYWGGLVFPPFAILLGLVLLGGSVKGSTVLKDLRDKKGRPVRFPHQDIRKW